jgi:LacI family transcriptional regulator
MIFFFGGVCMVGIDDVVKVSGVSRSTVFRFLNGSNVRSDAKKSIICAMERLNYKVDNINKLHNITIEISTSDNFESFKGFTEVVRGITRKADEKGVKVNIVRRKTEQIESDYSNWNIGDSLKGVIIIGKNIKDEEAEARILIRKQIPHIFINRVMDDPRLSYVAIDLKRATYEITEYLLRGGHRNIAICGNPSDFRVDRDKMEGYKQALTDNGIAIIKNLYHETNMEKDWEIAFGKILSGDEVPTAYIGICDSHAMKFIRTAQTKGYSVPKDIAVVGMDDVDGAEYFKPSLTTVHVPFKKMGMLAVESLTQCITNSEISCVKNIIKHELIIRESCGS